MESMAGADKSNVPYDDNTMYSADGLQLLSIVETSPDDSGHVNLFKDTQDLKTVSGSHKSVT